jgi:hypothetical protein
LPRQLQFVHNDRSTTSEEAVILALSRMKEAVPDAHVSQPLKDYAAAVVARKSASMVVEVVEVEEVGSWEGSFIECRLLRSTLSFFLCISFSLSLVVGVVCAIGNWKGGLRVGEK